MKTNPMNHEGLPPETAAFYREAITIADRAGVPFLVGGAYALHHYTGIARHTKDFDLFVRSGDVRRLLEAYAGAGCRTEVTFPHWLAKAYRGDDFIDIIFSSGNGVCKVDDGWFRHSVRDGILGEQVRICPPEEMIWSKGFIMERERFDGADVAHLIRARGAVLEWRRLLTLFGPYWHVLLAHLVLFTFIYPAQRDIVPEWLLGELTERLEAERKSKVTAEPVCRGTLLSREQYLPDIETWGYEDPRLKPQGNMSRRDVAGWTAGIEDDPPTVSP